jgi:uncharacterized protein YndB with AHSA1/START domain
MKGGEKMNDTHKELKLTRTIDASAELLYKAWTDEQMVKEWWGPEGVFIPVCEVDPRPGGKIHIVMEAGESMGEYKGTKWPMTGEFVELDEPKKITFTANAVTDGKEVLQHRTTVTFDPVDGKTKMTVHVVVTKVLPGSEYAIAGMEQGWNSQFDKLVKFVTAKK